MYVSQLILGKNENVQSADKWQLLHMRTYNTFDQSALHPRHGGVYVREMEVI